MCICVTAPCSTAPSLVYFWSLMPPLSEQYPAPHHEDAMKKLFGVEVLDEEENQIVRLILLL
jgi:hypothetical protein